MILDLHVHTAISPCGHMEVGDIIERAGTIGLEGVCITDHDTMEIRHRIREGVQDNGLIVLFGMEYSTDQGDFLLFGPFEELPPGLPADTLLPTVRQAGGAAIAAHPCRAVRPSDVTILQKGLCDAVETSNGRNTTGENRLAMRLSEACAMASCGGSDAHTPAEIGSFATQFADPVHTRRALIQALRQGRCRPIVTESDHFATLQEPLLPCPSKFPDNPSAQSAAQPIPPN